MKGYFALLLVIVVVFLLGGEKGGVMGSDFEPIEPAPCNSTFSCILRNFTIFVPKYETTTHGFKVTLTNLNCTGFSIGHIDSSTELMNIDNTDDEAWTLGVNVTDIGLVCDVHFHYKIVGFPYPQGSGDVSISLYGTHLDLDISIEDEEEGKQGDLSGCDFVVNVDQAELKTDIVTAGVIKGLEGTILAATEEAINGELCDKILQNLVNNDLTNVLSLVSQFYLPPPPPLSPLDVPPNIVNLTDSRILELLNKFTGEYGTEVVNFVVTHFTNNGSIAIGSGDLVDFSFDLPITLPFGEFNKTFILTAGLGEVEIKGLNTFNNVTLLEPVGETELESILELEDLEISISTLLEISLLQEEKEKEKEKELLLFKSESVFTIFSEDDKIEIIGQAIIDKNEIIRTVNYPLSLGSLPCDSLIINNMTILTLSLTSGGGGVEGEVVGEDNSGVGELVDNVVLLVLRSLGEGGVKTIENLIGGFGRDFIDNIIFEGLGDIHDEAGECTPSFPQKSNHWRYQAKVFSFLTALLLSIIVMGILSYKYIKRKIREQMTEQSPLVNPFEPTRDPPLGLHPEIPWFVRTGVPTLLFLLIASFISSNTGTGAAVLADVDFETEAGESVRIVNNAPLFDFSLWNSVHDMWAAGVYPLSILIFVFSGLWPYTKVFLMLFCWLAPTSILSAKKREYFLIMLDALGKWSLIDTYVLVLMLVAFRFEIGLGFLDINLIVEPKPGFYLFLVATIGSLLMTHLIVAIHRHVRFPQAVREFECDLVNPLYALAFPLGGKLVRCTIFGIVAVPVLLFIAFCFVIWGSVVESFAFTFGGLAGWALGDDAAASYSLISVGQAISDSVMDPGAGITFIQACFFIFALAVPLSHLLCLFLLWLVPMSGHAQRRTFVLAEVLNAWSALEVFVISIIAALLEISQFASFIVGDDCDPINKLLHLPPLDKLVDGDDTCFDVKASLSSGCWILFAACLIYVACRMLVMHVCHESLEYRYAKGKKHLLSSKQVKHLQSLTDDEEEDDLVVVEEDAGIMCKIMVFLKLVNYTIE